MTHSKRAARGQRRPLRPGGSPYPPQAPPTRQSVQQRAAAPLVFLHQLPRWLLPAVMAALLITGLAVGGPGGAVALCGVAVVLGLLAFVSWPQATPAGRLGRVAAICVLLALAVVQAAR